MIDPLHNRCSWPNHDPLMIRYHDEEWGVPLHDDRKLFEFMVLDAFQAGLSWSIVLKKRENFREALDNFQPGLIARYDENKIQNLLQNPGIIRNRLKLKATVANAQRFLEIQKEFVSFDRYIWQFTAGSIKANRWKKAESLPVSTKESDTMSLDLKKRGFKFAGSTICYAFMQAAGMVNDHLVTCFRHKEVNEMT